MKTLGEFKQAVAALVDEQVEIDESTSKIADHLIKRYGNNVRKSHIRSAVNDLGGDYSKVSKLIRNKLNKTTLDESTQLNESWGVKTQSYKRFKEIAQDWANHNTHHGKVDLEHHTVEAGGRKWLQTRSYGEAPNGKTYSIGVFNHKHPTKKTEEGGGQHHDYEQGLDEQFIDEISTDLKKRYLDKADKWLNNTSIIKKDKSGVDLKIHRKGSKRAAAADKVADSITELSAQKLDQYFVKASADRANHPTNPRKFNNRSNGMSLSWKKEQDKIAESQEQTTMKTLKQFTEGAAKFKPGSFAHFNHHLKEYIRAGEQSDDGDSRHDTLSHHRDQLYKHYGEKHVERALDNFDVSNTAGRKTAWEHVLKYAARRHVREDTLSEAHDVVVKHTGKGNYVVHKIHPKSGIESDQLKVGEKINDTHIDDLHDMGFKVKIHSK